MTRFAHERIRGPLWRYGVTVALLDGIVVVGLLIWLPPIRWFLAVAIIIGFAMAGIMRWYYARVPVKLDTKDQIVLHLNDDDEVSR